MNMKRTLIAAVLLAGLGLQAHALGRIAQVTLVDRASGAELPTHYYRGEYWVAGAPGARYAISVRNRMGERMLVVTSVDGVNVMTGDTAGWEQSGYVLRPGQGYEITGWRKSDAQVAAFEFSASDDSYAGRTGRPANVGVIGVALFRELVPEPLPYAERAAPSALKAAPTPAPAAPAAGAAADAARSASQGSLAASGIAKEAQPVTRLGTAHGQREVSQVWATTFARRSSAPDEVIRIRYDSRENLVAMGVIPQRPLPLPVPNPFPESPTARYVPDPPALR